MKKVSISLAIIIAFSLTLPAQETKVFGPRAGDFMISIVADPFLEFAGNLIAPQYWNDAPYVEFIKGYNLFGKYFTTDNTGIRAGLSFDYGSETQFFGEEDENKRRDSDFFTMISLGLEKRHGQNRAQAFYGPSAGIGFGSSSRVNTYDETPTEGTLLKEKYGSMFRVNLGLFAGFEYYICRSFAIGTEFGFGLNVNSYGKGFQDREGQDRTETGSKSTDIYFGFEGAPHRGMPSMSKKSENGYYWGNLNFAFKF